MGHNIALKSIIVLFLFFIQNDTFSSTKKFDNHRNPYLLIDLKKYKLKVSQFRKIIKENNKEYLAANEKFNQAVYELKATLKRKYPTIDLESNGLPSYLISDEYRNPEYNANTGFESNKIGASISKVINWNIIDPDRKAEIAIKRLNVDKAKNALSMVLSDLNLN